MNVTDRMADEDLSLYINFVIQCTTPKSMTVDIIKTATESDSTLQDVIKHIAQNDWYTKPVDERLKAYFHVKDELSISPEGILLRGTRIVIPETLQ